MSDAPFSDLEPDEPALSSSFVLTDTGWEETDFVEPGPDWKITEDGSYVSPDGLTRTRVTSEPAEWSDAADTR